MLHWTVLSLFPQLLEPWTQEAILGKGVQKGLLGFALRDIRAYTPDKHRSVDDAPYGGGAGMVLRVDVLEQALKDVQAEETIMLTPAGEPFSQRLAEELATKQSLALLCGRYEGFDARSESLVTRQVSVGDYVMMGGEAAALCIIEAVSRLVPGVLGDAESHQADSFSSGLLDYPEFTRPATWQGQDVPAVLLGGNHAQIALWRRQQALERTLARRPELLASAGLSDDDLRHLLQLGVSLETLARWGYAAPPETKQKKRRA